MRIFCQQRGRGAGMLLWQTSLPSHPGVVIRGSDAWWALLKLLRKTSLKQIPNLYRPFQCPEQEMLTNSIRSESSNGVEHMVGIAETSKGNFTRANPELFTSLFSKECPQIQTDLSLPTALMLHVATEESDHMALVIRVADEPSNRTRNKPGFRFEEMWTMHEGFDGMLRDAWDSHAVAAGGLPALCNKLKHVSADMQRWARRDFGSVRQQIKQLRSKLDETRQLDRSPQNSQEIRPLAERSGGQTGP